jgi:3-phosphoshikimate 1-carboxyvinyltransferase
MGEILAAVSALGAEVLDGEGIPCTIRGQGSIPGGVVTVDATRSTQFATAMMLVSPFADGPIRIELGSLGGSGGYLDLTADVLGAFGADFSSLPDGWVFQPSHLKGTSFHVEPDASAAVYPLAAAAVTGNDVRIAGLGASSRQPDMAVVEALESMGCEATIDESSITLGGPDSGLRGIDLDVSAWPDGAMALAATCAVATSPSTLRGLHSLQYKESERIAAMAEGLTRVGARVEATGSELNIVPGPLRPAEVRAHGDHRVAMSFGVLSLAEPGIVVDEPGVVTKTWPGYWEVMERLAGLWEMARRGT